MKKERILSEFYEVKSPKEDEVFGVGQVSITVGSILNIKCTLLPLTSLTLLTCQ